MLDIALHLERHCFAFLVLHTGYHYSTCNRSFTHQGDDAGFLPSNVG